MNVVLVDDDEDAETDFGGSEPPTSPTDEMPTEVSLNSVIGLSSPRTMNLTGKIGDRAVVVMIDSGATHNFISLLTVEKLGIEVWGSGGFGVSLGNGEAIRGTGIFYPSNWVIQTLFLGFSG